jgi:hypothetical protein
MIAVGKASSFSHGWQAAKRRLRKLLEKKVRMWLRECRWYTLELESAFCLPVPVSILANEMFGLKSRDFKCSV